MSDDHDLKTIRRLDALDIAAIAGLLAPDCVYHEDPYWLDGRVVRGRAEVIATLAGYVDLWGTVSQQIEAVERIGAAVVASIRQRGVTPAGQVPFEHVWTYVFRMSNGQISELWAYSDSVEGRKMAARV